MPHISRHCGRIVNDNIIYVFTAESDDRRILKSSLNLMKIQTRDHFDLQWPRAWFISQSWILSIQRTSVIL